MASGISEAEGKSYPLFSGAAFSPSVLTTYLKLPDFRVALSDLSRKCTEVEKSIESLSSPARTPSSNDSANGTGTPDLPVFVSDFKLLCQSLKSLTTNLSLSMKPPPSLPATIKTSQDLTWTIDRFGSCIICSAALDHQGPLLVKELRYRGQAIVNSLNCLSSIYSSLKSPSLVTGKQRDEQLKTTGLVWEKIDEAVENVGDDEVEMVRRGWREQLETFDDVLREVADLEREAKEFSEEAGVEGIEGTMSGLSVDGEGGDDGNDDDDDDDFFDDMNDPSSSKLSPKEIERLSATIPLIRLSRLIIKRLSSSTSFSSGQSHPPPELIAHLSNLFKASKFFLESQDELVSSLYAPQDPSLVASNAEKYSDLVKRLTTEASKGWKRDGGPHQATQEKVEGDTDEREKKERKWFTMAEEQVEKALKKLKEL